MLVCQKCQNEFTITQREADFHTRLNVPSPTWCFECRLQRKMMFRNYQNLSRGECRNCGKSIVSMFHAESPATVWCTECFTADTWDAQQYAQDIDWSKPFLAQLKELYRQVPQQHLNLKQNENSPWNNHQSQSKNCYMNFGGISNEDGAYNHWSGYTAKCLDNYALLNSQLCYETNLVTECYQTYFSHFVFGSHEVYFSENCFNSSNLIGCVNLKNKSYHIFNQSVSPEEYQAEVKKLRSYTYQQEFKQRFDQFKLTQPVPAVHHTATSDSTGDYLVRCHDCVNVFTAAEVQNCTNGFSVGFAKDCMDIFSCSLDTELCYEYGGNGLKCYRLLFSFDCEASQDLYYSLQCTNCSDCFGCVGLKNKRYCILNKQYTQEEYKKLLPRLIQHMKDLPYVDVKGRKYAFGEFLPQDFSPFSYNDSIIQDFFPLTPEQVQAEGLTWRIDAGAKYTPTLQSSELPDTIDQVEDSILKQTIACEHYGTCTDHCTYVFPIIPMELEFLRSQGMPLPRLCPNCRHIRRVKQKNPMKLWERPCQCAGLTSKSQTYQNQTQHDHGTDACPRVVSTTYAPARPEMIYCQECYLAEVV